VDYSDHDEEAEETDKEDRAADQVTVGPLTPRVGLEELYEILSSFGELLDIEFQQEAGRSRVALARFRTAAEAREAARAMDGGTIDRQEVLVVVRHSRPGPPAAGDINANLKPGKME
jgi:hypothetical protein